MKKLLIIIIGVLLTGGSVFAQSQAEISRDQKGIKILKGIISRDDLEKDTTFAWYAENLKGYAPNTLAIEGLKKNKDSIQLIAFMGTWCEDSHFVIPRLFSLLDQANFPKDRVTLIGTDRDKKTLSHLSEAMNVTNVPTIIVMKKGKEMGRVIEYGHDGLFDKELGEIINGVR